MVLFPPKFVISSTLKVGVVYKMVAPELINTDIPHYFVVVAVHENENYMLLSTTQLQNKINYFNNVGYDLDTLAYLESNSTNGLTEDSYFDCNQYYTITKDKLEDKVSKEFLKISGNISQEEYEKLLKAIDLSNINDIPLFLLKYN